VGKIMVSNTGAVGMLNDPTHSVLEIHDARTARIQAPTKLLEHFELIRMLKPQVCAVCLPRREDLGPQALVRGGYTGMLEYPVRIAMQAFEIEGVLEFPGRFDLAALMTEGSRAYIPLFNGTLTGILVPGLRVETGGMLINRRHIDLVALLSQRVKQEKPAASRPG
jgi:hypothetical protein